MAKPTLQNIADELGITLQDVQRAKRDGVNPYDREEVKRWASNKREYTPRGIDTPPAPPSDESSLTIEEIEANALKPGLTKREVDVSKAQVAVLREALAYKVQRNKLLTRAECDERDAKIGHAMQGMLRRMENEIPALCLGKSSLGEIKEITKAKIRECQALFSNEMSEFWTDRPEL